MKSQKKKFYIRLPDVKDPIEVTHEVYCAYDQPIWRTWKFAHYHGRCILEGSKWHRCQGDCGICSYQISGDLLSMDEELSSNNGTYCRKDTLKAEITPYDEMRANTELLKELSRQLEGLTAERKAICHNIMQGVTQTSASETMGMSRSSYRYRMSKLLPQLKENLEDFY